MSILTELKKLTKKKNATVISQALPDSLDGDGSGSSGGGANVLTLYLGEKNGAPWAYKNEEHTEEYATAEEAGNAVQNAGIIKCVTEFDVIFADRYSVGNSVFVYIIDVNPDLEALDVLPYTLFQRGQH